jgi:hypothetical protein
MLIYVGFITIYYRNKDRCWYPYVVWQKYILQFILSHTAIDTATIKSAS